MNLVDKIKVLNNYLQTKNFNKVIEGGKKNFKKSSKQRLPFKLNWDGVSRQISILKFN